MTDEPSGKSIRPKAQSVRVQSTEIVPASPGREEGILQLLDKQHTTKAHPIITNEVRNLTPSDQDLIDASKDDSSSRPAEYGHVVGYDGESESERKELGEASLQGG